MSNPLCKCGCGQEVSLPTNKYILGHARSNWNKKEDFIKKLNSNCNNKSNIDANLNVLNKDEKFSFESYNTNKHKFQYDFMVNVLYLLSKLVKQNGGNV